MATPPQRDDSAAEHPHGRHCQSARDLDSRRYVEQRGPHRLAWHGFVARRNLTLLTSLWKAGKTTLLLLLLSRRQAGGQLAGLPVQLGKTVVVSEEPLSLWADRDRLHGYANQVCIFSRPLPHVPTLDEWQALPVPPEAPVRLPVPFNQWILPTSPPRCGRKHTPSSRTPCDAAKDRGWVAEIRC
jgi:hypothetical protein